MSTSFRCMSSNSSILRRAACASSPLPTTQVSSGGVMRRHSQRVAPRRNAPSVVTKNQIIAACAIVNGGTGTM